MGRLNVPAPASYIVGRGGGVSSRPGKNDADPFEEPKEARIRWLNAVGSQLRTERSTITQEMRRNRELYDDKHWATFGASRRAPWKFSGVINVCAYIVDRKAALISDAKPKVSYVTHRLEDSEQAEIMGAAFTEWYEEDHIQHKIEQAVKACIIRKVAYLKMGYDPAAREGRGDITARVVDGINVYVNREATSTYDAELLIHEYTEPFGKVMERWPKLRGNIDLYAGITSEGDDERSEQMGGTGSVPRIQPAQYYSDPQNVTQHTAPYGATESSATYDREGARCLVREVWSRPRGPRNETTVSSLEFTVAGQLATKRKYLEFSDGHVEPLQTVVMGNGVVYELPLSIVPVLEFAGNVLGGVPVLHATDSLVAKTKKKRVPLYPTGRRMIAVGNAVAEDGCNPFAHGHFPFVKIQENYALEYYPRTSIDRNASMQDCFNRIFSMIFDSAHLTANPIWRMPTNSEISDEEITNAPGAVQREDPTSLKLGKREPGPEIPSYVMPYLEFIFRTMRDMAGLSEAATGGKFKGQQSAETVSMYQEAAGISFRPSLRLIEQSIVELGTQYEGLVKQFYTKRRYVRLQRANGIAERHVPFIGSLLSAEMRIQVKAGSMLPTSPSARLNYVLNLLNTPGMDLPELWRNLEEIGIIESASGLHNRIESERRDPNRNWLIPALNPPGGKNNKRKIKSNAGRSSRATTPMSAADKRG